MNKKGQFTSKNYETFTIDTSGKTGTTVPVCPLFLLR